MSFWPKVGKFERLLKSSGSLAGKLRVTNRPQVLARRFTTEMSLPKSFPLKLAGSKTGEIPTVGFGTWAFEGGPTDPANPKWIKDAISTAFDVGYRHLECAWFYGVSWIRRPMIVRVCTNVLTVLQVDHEIGEAIRDYGISRSDLFICSKIWGNFYQPEAVEMCCDKILEGMQVDYVDLLLLHWPCAFKPISFEALKTASAANQGSMWQKGMAEGKLLIDWKYTSEPTARASGHEGSIVPTWNAMKELVKKGKARAIGVSNFSIQDLEVLLPHAEDVPISANQVEVHPWFPQNRLIS